MGKFLQTVAELACLKTMLIISNLAFWVSFNGTLQFASMNRNKTTAIRQFLGKSIDFGELMEKKSFEDI